MGDRSSAAEKGALWRVAQALNRSAAPQSPLPPLFFLTDPARTPDPVAIAERLPAGAGIIYRHFGAPGADDVAERLAGIAKARGLVLLIGQDAGLAGRCGAHGLHLPERDLAVAPALRRAHPQWLITGAAHGEAALKAAKDAGLDAALLSPVFESASASAGQALGVERFSALAKAAGLPVYALGGVDARTAPWLTTSGAAGLAAVEGVLEDYGS